MKILFITDNFPPEVNAPARRTFEHCKHWVDRGEKVTVITCFPNYPKGKVFGGYKNKLYNIEQMDGIKVVRVWSYIAANVGFIKRVFDHISFAKMAILTSFFIKKPDIIIATSPQFFTAVAGRLISFFKRRPWIMEVRDIWPESISALGMINRGKLYSVLEKIELYLYRSAHKVIVVTDSFKQNLVDRNIPSNKIEVIKNGIDLTIFCPQKVTTNLYVGDIEQKFKVGYIGTHGLAHNLAFVLDCAEKLQDKKEIHFVFIGDGAQKEQLITKAKDRGIDNVTFIDSVPKMEVVKYISSLDVALIPLKKSETFKSVLPSKIFENAAMGIPILLGVEGEAKELIEKYNAGISYEPECESDFINKLLEIYNNVDLQNALSQGGKKLALNFDRKKLANKMLNILYDE